MRDRGGRSPRYDDVGYISKYLAKMFLIDFVNVTPLTFQDAAMEPPKIIDTLRMVTALENLLGSLGPQINAMMSRALSLEKKRADSANLLLEDADAAAIIELTKEKLAGQVVAGLLTGTQEDAVKNCISKMNVLLQCATKKRPEGPPSLLGSSSDKEYKDREKLKSFLAESLARQLVIKGLSDIDDWELHKVVYSIAEKTALDDGSLCPPSTHPPPKPAPMPMDPGPTPSQYGYYNQGYSSSGPGM